MERNSLWDKMLRAIQCKLGREMVYLFQFQWAAVNQPVVAVLFSISYKLLPLGRRVDKLSLE